MTLAEAMAQFESQFDVVSAEIGFPDSKGDWSRAPTGDRYITVVSGGIKSQGEPFPASFDKEEDAIQAWIDTAAPLAAVGRRLWWRERPDLEWRNDWRARSNKKKATCNVRSRFVVTP